jgi:hypothetical protein
MLRLAALAALIACHSNEELAPRPSGAVLPLDRIAIVGASVSAGFGGTPFGEAFTAAAPRAVVESEANVVLFRDPLGDTKHQLDRAVAFHPTVVIALDLLFWDAYGASDQAWRLRAVQQALAELDRIRAAGAWIVLGDIPRITTAAEWILAKENVPAVDALAEINAAVTAWANGRDRVVLVPLVAWTEPLRAGATVELSPGERVEARRLMAVDGLHANPLGTWYLLDKLDHFLETKFPGTPADALVFVRPRS